MFFVGIKCPKVALICSLNLSYSQLMAKRNRNFDNEEYHQKIRPPKYQGNLFDELAQRLAEIFIAQVEKEPKEKNKYNGN